MKPELTNFTSRLLKVIGSEQDFGMQAIRVPQRRFTQCDARDVVEVVYGDKKIYAVLHKDRELKAECIMSWDMMLNLGVQLGEFVGVNRATASLFPAQQVLIKSFKAHVPYEKLLRVARAYLSEPLPLVQALVKEGLAVECELTNSRTFIAQMLGRPLNKNYCIVVGGLLYTITRVKPLLPGIPILLHTSTVSSKEETFEERLRAAFKRVGGLKKEIKILTSRIAIPIDHAHLLKRLDIKPLKGVLLYGPPGTGKTLIAKSVATVVRASFYAYSATEFCSKYVGEGERRMRAAFEKARQSAPAVIFIDEIDAIASKRSSETDQKVINQLLTEMDGITTGEQFVLVMAATNREGQLDSAIRRAGRFDLELEIPTPDRDARAQILELQLQDTPLAPDVDLNVLAEITNGYTGADLQLMHKEAGFKAITDALEDNAELRPEDLYITMADCKHAVNNIRPSGLKNYRFSVPLVAWSEVLGAEEEIASIEKEIILPYRNRDLFAELGFTLPSGVIFYGPPGTGKTLLACALATQLGFNMITVQGPEFISKFVGQSEARVRDLFMKARHSSPCMILIDEIDAVFGTREHSEHTASVTGQILAEIDGLVKGGAVLVVGTTNRIDNLDRALTRAGRLEKKIYIGRPNVVALEKMLRRNLLKIKLNLPRATLVHYAELMQQARMTCADVKSFTRNVLAHALSQGIQLGEIPDALPYNTLLELVRRKESQSYSQQP